MNRVFNNGPGFSPKMSHIKDLIIIIVIIKYLMPPCLTLSIIMYVSRVSGASQEKKLYPPLHLGVVAIEKGAFGSPLTMFGQLT